MVDWKKLGKTAFDVTKDVTEKGIDSFQEWKDDPERINRVEEKKALKIAEKKIAKTEKEYYIYSQKMNKKLRDQNLSISLLLRNSKDKQVRKIRKFSKTSQTRLYQQFDGKVYFDDDIKQLFEIIEYHWDGPTYKDISETVTKDTGDSGIGDAVLGGLLAGGTGAVVGAISGKKNDSKSTTIHHKDVEQPSLAKLFLKDLKSNNEMVIEFMVLSSDNDILVTMSGKDNFSEEQSLKYEESYISELRELKYLLDEGIITREEFNKKKEELLGL